MVPAQDDPNLIVNLTDHIVQARGKAPFFHLDERLPYPGLEGTTLNAIEIRDFVNRIGNVLLNAGLRRGDRVAIYKTNAPDYILLSLGVIKAGGISVPVNPNMSLTDFAYYTKYTGATFLFTDEAQYLSKIKTPGALPDVTTWIFPEAPDGFTGHHIDLSKVLAHTSATLVPREIHGDTPVYLCHTSGTTGYPKAVISVATTFTICLRGLVQNQFPNYSVPFKEIRDGICFGFPFHHIISQALLNATLLGSAQIYTMSGPFNAEANLSRLDREDIHFYLAFPQNFHQMYEFGLERYNLKRLKLWWSASDVMHEIHLQAFTERSAPGAAFVDAIGTSEIGSVALARAFYANSPIEGRRLIGTTMPRGPRVRIADENGRDLPPGEVGRLMVHAPTLFRGYWNRHDTYLSGMLDGWFWTGDVAYADKEGRVYHMDRVVDVIKTRGGPVYSLLIEERLMNHPDVGDAAVIAVPHPEEGEVPVGVVYLRKGKTATGDSIRGWHNDHQGAQKLAAVFVVQRDEIPRGMTGKNLKVVLKKSYEHLYKNRR